MADHVERVGLVFKEDGSTDFIKSLKLVNSNLKENFENFKLIQTQWDKSTSTTQKLKDKMVYLNEAYDIQKQKVNVLNAELKELENAENRNEVAISKKKAQLTQAEASLQRYKNQIDEVNVKLKTHSEEIKKTGEKLENYGNKIEKAGNKFSAFSAATLAAFTAATKGAIEFESDFTGVEKTVDGTDEQLQKLKQDIRDLAKEIPSTTKEISGVAEAAGQLGIATDDIMSFTKVMIDLGNSTNLSAEEAASALAKFANVTNMNAEEYSNLGSTIVALGNNFATTEKDIVEMATRLASTGEITGLTQAQILALSTALSSAGIEAEAGGSAMAKLLKKMNLASETYENAYKMINKTGLSLRDLQLMASNNSKDFKALADSIGLTSEELKTYMSNADSLEDFARVAGLTADEFQRLYGEDSVKALSAFIGGLQDTERNGKGAVEILSDMGLTEVRLSNAVLAMSTSQGLMNNAIDLANQSWKENNALNKEASKRYDTLKSKMTISINKLKDTGITIGNKLMPHVEKAVDKFDEWTKKFDELDDSQVENIIKIGATVVALGPLLKIIGSVTTGTGKLVKGFGNLKETLGIISLRAGGSGTALSGLSTILSGLVSPAGLATAGLAAMVGTTIYLSEKSKILSEDVKKLKDNVDSQRESWDRIKEASQQYIDANSKEITSLEYLKEELEKVVDGNGKVKAGYEERAEYIVNQLSSALGIEIGLNNGIIENYQSIGDEIDKIITKKKAELLLDAYKEKYAEAIKNQAEAVRTLTDIQEEMLELEVEIAKVQNEGGVQSGKRLMELQGQHSALNAQLQKQMELTSEYGYTIQNYEDLTKASTNGTAEEIEKAVDRMGISWERAKDSQGKSLRAQKEEQDEYIKDLERLLKTAENKHDEYSEYIIKNQLETAKTQRDNLSKQIGDTTIQIEMSADDMAKAWEGVSNRANKAYDETLDVPLITRNQIRSAEQMINSDGTINHAWLVQSRNSRDTIESIINMSEIVKNQTNEASQSISNDTSVVTAVQGVTNNVNSALITNVDGNKWGQDLIDEMSSGLRNQSKLNTLVSAASGVATKIKNILGFSIPEEGPLSDFDKSMPDMIDLMVAGLRKSAPKLEAETKNIAQNMKENLETKPQNYMNNQQIKEFSSSSTGITEDILYRCIFKALNNCKIKFDKSGFIKFIDNRLLEVM